MQPCDQQQSIFGSSNVNSGFPHLEEIASDDAIKRMSSENFCIFPHQIFCCVNLNIFISWKKRPEMLIEMKLIEVKIKIEFRTSGKQMYM